MWYVMLLTKISTPSRNSFRGRDIYLFVKKYLSIKNSFFRLFRVGVQYYQRSKLHHYYQITLLSLRENVKVLSLLWWDQSKLLFLRNSEIYETELNVFFCEWVFFQWLLKQFLPLRQLSIANLTNLYRKSMK